MISDVLRRARSLRSLAGGWDSRSVLTPLNSPSVGGNRGFPNHRRMLPSGQVTFFLTDIEGSTRLWEEHPEAMAGALTRHDSLLTRAIERNTGVVLKARGEGDSVFAVFAHPRDAVRAALHAQLLLQSEIWPEPLLLKVRIAIHTGEVELGNGDYYGPVVNRSARLRAIAHGEQTIVSASAQGLLDEDMGDDLALRDLGWHRLKDLREPERVFQICHPSLPSEFPPLLSLDLFPNNLPVQRTSFVGRESAIGELKELLRTASLVTLTGTGGAGKSRLAQQLAAEVLEMFRSGAWLVELASLTEPDLVPQSIAAALGLRQRPGRPVIESLREFLAQKSLLLVLDNCEHLIGACAEVVDQLLNSSTELKVLATSREPLQIAGEVIWRVPSLSVPDHEVETVEDLTKFESVRLFLDRLSLSRPGSRLRAKDLSALTSISRRLDGIPLALELAAARARAMPLSEIASGLDDRFALLTSGVRTALPRHQTLRAAVSWSYDGLSEDERVLFRRLSVFSGGFTLKAAQQICGIEVTPMAVSDLTSRLVDKSLLNIDASDDSSRYGLLETIRQYAAELLSESGEEKEIRARHLEWFSRKSERYQSNLLAGEETRWLDELEPEHDNVRAALEWALGNRGETRSGIALAESMWLFWWLRGYVKEGIRWLNLALKTTPSESETLSARALFAISFLSYHDANLEDAQRYAELSLAAVESPGNLAPDWAKPAAQILLAECLGDAGNYEGAWPVIEEALKTVRLLELGWGLGFALSIAGGLAYAQGDKQRARTYWEEMLEIQRDRRIEVGLLIALQSLARLESEAGNLTRARTLYEESLEIRRRMGAKRLGFHGGIVAVLDILGSIAYEQNDYLDARRFADEALEIARGFDDRPAMANALSLLSKILRAEGELEQAEEYAARAASMG